MSVWRKAFMAAALSMILAFLILAGCTEGKPAKAPGQLKIGLLPINDALPFWVAQQKGYFQQEGVEVELVNFSSAVERDSAFQAGEIDGEITDPLGSASLIASGVKAKILSIVLGATPQEGRFAILAAPNSGITQPEELANVEVAISPNTIIEYVVDRLLLSKGLKPEQIRKQAIVQIPVRFQMLMEGKVKAAALPDPLAKLAETQGAKLIIDDTSENLSQTVLLFRQTAIDSKSDAISKMFTAYRRAVEDINANPESYRATLEERARLPKGLAAYQLERFPQPQAPREEHLQSVVKWMLDKGLLKSELSYSEMVDDRFVRGKQR